MAHRDTCAGYRLFACDPATIHPFKNRWDRHVGREWDGRCGHRLFLRVLPHVLGRPGEYWARLRHCRRLGSLLRCAPFVLRERCSPNPTAGPSFSRSLSFATSLRGKSAMATCSESGNRAARRAERPGVESFLPYLRAVVPTRIQTLPERRDRVKTGPIGNGPGASWPQYRASAVVVVWEHTPKAAA